MQHNPLNAVILFILSCTLTGCSLSLPPPSPGQLLAVFTQSFTCGFSGYDGTDTEYRAALVRTDAGDTLTVYGTHADTVFRLNGAAPALQTRGSADTPPLTLPLPDGYDRGMTAFLPLFSVLSDESFSSFRTDGGITVKDAHGRYSALFSEDGMPCRITLDGKTAVIDSFAVTTPPAAP